MDSTKRSEKARDNGPAAKIQIIMLVLLSYGITSVAAVDVDGFAYNFGCTGVSTYGCGDLRAADCCGFHGLEPALSIKFTGVPRDSFSYSWTALSSDPDCGVIHGIQRSIGQPLCHRSRPGVSGMSGASWSAGGHSAVAGDGAVVPISKCKNVVKATIMKVNATADSRYPVDNKSSTSSNHTDNSTLRT